MDNFGFIDSFSSKCLLGPMAKDIESNGNIFKWRVNKNNHFVVIDNYKLNDDDVLYLSSFSSLNFHYLSFDNCSFLTKRCKKVEKSRSTSYIIGIDEINYSGNKNKTIRNYMNRYKDFEIRDNYKKITDVSTLVEEWAITLGEKYFRNFSGKNLYFLKNNYHIGCNNVFVYDNEKLVSFGIGSPVRTGQCSYVIGKALAKTYPGLSEFTDMKLYEKIYSDNGKFKINMGKAEGGLVFYKQKFPNAVTDFSYDGKVII